MDTHTQTKAGEESNKVANDQIGNQRIWQVGTWVWIEMGTRLDTYHTGLDKRVYF